MLCAERSILVFIMKKCVVNKAKFVCVCVNRPAVTKLIWDSVQVN